MPFHGRAEPGGIVDEGDSIRALLMEAVDDVTLQPETGRNDITCLPRLPLDAGYDEIRRERKEAFHETCRLCLALLPKRPQPRRLLWNQDRHCVTNEHDVPVHGVSPLQLFGHAASRMADNDDCDAATAAGSDERL